MWLSSVVQKRCNCLPEVTDTSLRICVTDICKTGYNESLSYVLQKTLLMLAFFCVLGIFNRWHNSGQLPAYRLLIHVRKLRYKLRYDSVQSEIFRHICV